MKSAIAFILGLLTATLAFSAESEARHETSDQETVVVLHGLARSASSMHAMEQALMQAGYRVCNVAYPSRSHSIAELASQFVAPAIARCAPDAARPLNFVTHSLGGIIVRELAKSGVAWNFGRVVMLGPPNQGSEVVDSLGGWQLFRFINGPAGGELGTSQDSTPRRLGPATFQVGIVAGTHSINWINSLIIPGVDDGKVSIARAKLDGMQDFIKVGASHPFLMNDRDAIKQTIRFLDSGCFAHGKATQESDRTCAEKNSAVANMSRVAPGVQAMSPRVVVANILDLIQSALADDATSILDELTRPITGLHHVQRYALAALNGDDNNSMALAANYIEIVNALINTAEQATDVAARPPRPGLSVTRIQQLADAMRIMSADLAAAAMPISAVPPATSTQERLAALTAVRVAQSTLRDTQFARSWLRTELATLDRAAQSFASDDGVNKSAATLKMNMLRSSLRTTTRQANEIVGRANLASETRRKAGELAVALRDIVAQLSGPQGQGPWID